MFDLAYSYAQTELEDEPKLHLNQKKIPLPVCQTKGPNGETGDVICIMAWDKDQVGPSLLNLS